MKKPHRKPQKPLPDLPAFTLDTLRASFHRRLGNRFDIPTDDTIRQVYDAMRGWYPWIVAEQRDQSNPEQELIAQANRDGERYIRSLQRLKEIRDKAVQEAKQKAATDPVWQAELMIRRSALNDTTSKLAIVTETYRIPQKNDPPDGAVRRLTGWQWVWKHWPAAIEAAIRTANPRFPYSGRKGEGKTERGPSIVAQIMSDLLPAFTGEQPQSAAAIERELQRLKAEAGSSAG